MSRIRRMQPILRLASLQLEQAGTALLRAQQQVQLEIQRLSQLEGYQLEYRRDLQRAGERGIAIGELRLYDSFQQQLDQAIQHQRQVIEHATQQLQRTRQAWQHRDMRHKSLQKMLERLQKEADLLQSRNEQRNHDEYARRRSSGW